MSRRFEPLVLCYHAVSGSWNHALAVDEPLLERHLRAVLRLRFRPARLEDALAGRGRLVHVTFDDAFRSVARALPLLERLRLPATVFACSGFAETGAPLAVPELERDAHANPAELATMKWDSLRELSERGIEIGSHTITHPHLTMLSDSEVRRELVDSRERLEAELRRPCRFLSYPYGETDARVRAAARAAGYLAAVALPGEERPRDAFALPRVGVYSKDGVARFLLKTSRVRRGVLALRGLRAAAGAR